MPKAKLTEEAATYEWLRGDHDGKHSPPPDFMWRMLQLMKNFDERLVALEELANVGKHSTEN